MNKPDDFDWLDKALSGGGNHIDDSGFTDIVMTRLPTRKPRRSRMRAVILFAAALLSGGIALRILPDLYVQLAGFMYSQSLLTHGRLLPSLSDLYAQLAGFVYSQSLVTLVFLSVALCAVSAMVTAWLLNLDK